MTAGFMNVIGLQERLTMPSDQSTTAADMDAIGWDDYELSRRLDVSPRSIQRWYVGTQQPPESIATWLHTLAEFHRANPAPVRENV